MAEIYDVKWWLNALVPILTGSKFEAKIETVQSGDYVGIAPKPEFKKSDKKKEQYLCVKPYKDGGYSTWMIKQVWEGSPLYGTRKPTRENAAKMPHFNDMEDTEFVLQIVRSFAGTSSSPYWPSLEEYDPGISKDMWLDVLRDETITNSDTLSMLKNMMSLGGESTCAHLAEVYGNTPAHYNSIGRLFGQRVKERYNCPDCVDTDDESEDRNRVYVIPFVGRYVKENRNKRYSWKLRDELKEALKAMALNEEYILTITANSVVSTDPNFTMDNLGLGDNYKPLDAWFEDVSGQKIKRKRAKNERKISNQTLPKLACQIFEAQLAALSVQDKAVFPTCQYDPKGKIYKGIYPNIEEFRKNLNSIEYLVYPCADGNQFVIYAWNIFSTILFVQECLKRFGSANEKFVLTYRDKTEGEGDEPSDDEGATDLVNHNLNTILYGPPGTGKTYHTAIYAVAIIENKALEVVAQDNYDDVLKRYNKYKKDGLIAFTTFHQSYGYEEFIEGIKPIVGGNDNVQYSVEDGTFKAFCKRATMPDDHKVDHNAKVWKVVLKSGDLVQSNTLKFECFNEGKIMYDWNTQQDHVGSYAYSQIEHFRDRVNVGDIVLTYAGHGTDIDAVGIVTGDAEYDEKLSSYKWSRTVEWIQYNKVVNIRELNGGKYLDNDVLQELKRVNISELFNLIGYSTTTATKKNFVFIIDEINRGNISKIFGELITLIEPSKRLGAEEELTAILPYSAKPFSVPNNVYIIGTMNTADRSIATIDTALRRRFYFKEMLPNSSILSGIEVEDIAIDKMLDLINKRIEVLYDREHTIGHAYFMPLKADPTLETLARIFENNIIPLLQEYFYEDYEKIRLVLGDNHKAEEAQFIVAKANDYAALFGNVDIGLDDGYSYVINKQAFDNIEAYRSI